MDKLKQFFKNKIYRRNIYMFVLLPLILNLTIESMSRDSIIQGIKYVFIHPVPFICNSMIILTVLSVALLIKRRIFYASLISAVCVFLGYMNKTLLEERVTPFNASDLKLLDAAVSIVDKYFKVVTIIMVAGIVSVIGIVIVLLFIKGPKIKYKINYWKNLIIIGLIVLANILVINVSIETGFMSKKFTNLTTAYNKYGFLYCFGNGLLNTGVKKPSGYSEDKIGKLLNEIETENVNDSQNNQDKVTAVDRKPNIIFLQLESFFNIAEAKDIQFSSDPIPYFNQLRQEYSSGYLNVFNVGYGTCNTEFEIITSMNLDDFGPGEIPYKTVLKSKVCESVAFDLKDYGYSTHAIHDNDATFYSRKTVFPHLGFDTFTSIEFMNIDEFTPEGWAKDKCLTNEIMKALKSTDKPDFVYTISVQGHGSYPTSKVLDNPPITVSGIEDEGRKNAIEYYANQIHEMDAFLKELTDALTAYGEDTILVMYGDHLPGLGFSADDLASQSIYKTNYVIWNNFGLPKEDEDIRSYQLAPKVLKSLNMTNGVINRYHQLYKDNEEYLSGLQNLEYDILYGDQIAYDGVSPYASTKMKMGIDDIDITKLEVEKVEEDQYVKIIGKNFTKSSKVFVNGDRYETEFIDNNTLRVKDNNLASLDSFVVSQVDKDSGYVVSSTKECLYYGQ